MPQFYRFNRCSNTGITRQHNNRYLRVGRFEHTNNTQSRILGNFKSTIALKHLLRTGDLCRC